MTIPTQYDVIVVDDEQSVTEIFQQYVAWKYKDWRFLAFNNSMSLYEAITQGELTAKVWVVDIMMPKKNGTEIAEVIRKKLGEKPVVLAYTALDRRVLETDESYKPRIHHFNRFINKREDFSAILSLVDVWVSSTQI
jgi:DNA-binding NtrC family response regulator